MMALIARQRMFVALAVLCWALPAGAVGHGDFDFDMPGSGSIWQYVLLLINLDEVVETVAFYTFELAVLLILGGVTYALRQQVWMAYTGLTILGLIYIGLNDQNLTGIYWSGLSLQPRALLVFGHLMISCNLLVAGFAIDPAHHWRVLRWPICALALVAWLPWMWGRGLSLDGATLVFNVTGMLAGLLHAVPFLTLRRLDGGPDRDLRIGIATLGVLLVLTTWIVSLAGQGWNVDIVLASRLLILAVTFFLVVFFIRRILAIRASREAAIAQTLADARREAEMSRELLVVQRQYAETRDVARQRQERLATASHDIRQPIASLRTTMEALTRQQPDKTQNQLREAFDYLDQLAGSYMAEGVSGGAATAEVSAETVSTSVLLDTIGRMFSAEAADRGLRLTIDDPRCAVSVAPLALMRILSNLVSNAIKHASGGTVAVTAAQDGAQVVFAVANDGVLPDGDVFANHVKGAASDGAGLGLGIIQALAVEHDLSFDHASSPETGTVFRVSVPAA